MLREIYTTRMSSDARALKRRFEKITVKPKKLAKLLGAVCILFLVASLILSTVVLAQFDSESVDVTITNHGEAISLENKPFVKDGAVYLPLREVCTRLGLMDFELAEMSWDNGIIRMNLFYGGAFLVRYSYRIEIGKAEIIVNPAELMEGSPDPAVLSVPREMKNAPILKNNLTYVPFEYFDYMINRTETGIGTNSFDLDIVASGKTMKIGYPLKSTNKITSSFGERVHPVTGEVKLHSGVDIAANEGDVIYSGIEGVVAASEFDGEKGNYIVIENDNGVTVSYLHMKTIYRNVGDRVEKGEEIGEAGSTGVATGAHVHLEMTIFNQYVNPELYFEKDRSVELRKAIDEKIKEEFGDVEYTISNFDYDDVFANVIVKITSEGDLKGKSVILFGTYMSDILGWSIDIYQFLN